MESLWEQTSGHTGFCHLEQDAKTDVLIIGGGIAGVLCAYLLHQAGVLYLLLEAETIGGGITKNTTAKITSQHGLIYDKLIRKFGAGQAKQYLDANEAALQKYRELCRGMDCDFEEKTAYVYSLNDRRKIERELDALEKLGVPGEFTDRLPLPFPVAGAVRYPNQAQFAAGRWRRPPHRKTGRGLAGTAGFRPAALSQGRGDIPLGYPGLHVSGRRSLYRPLFRQRIRPVCGHRFQQVGNDLRHGIGHGPVRSCPREAEPLCRGVFPLQNDSSPPIGGQWLRGRGQPPDPFRQALSPSRLRVEMEPAGAHVGLPLPRLPFYRGGQVDRQPGNGESEKIVPPNETAPSVFPV